MLAANTNWKSKDLYDCGKIDEQLYKQIVELSILESKALQFQKPIKLTREELHCSIYDINKEIETLKPVPNLNLNLNLMLRENSINKKIFLLLQPPVNEEKTKRRSLNRNSVRQSRISMIPLNDTLRKNSNKRKSISKPVTSRFTLVEPPKSRFVLTKEDFPLKAETTSSSIGKVIPLSNFSVVSPSGDQRNPVSLKIHRFSKRISINQRSSSIIFKRSTIQKLPGSSPLALNSLSEKEIQEEKVIGLCIEGEAWRDNQEQPKKAKLKPLLKINTTPEGTKRRRKNQNEQRNQEITLPKVNKPPIAQKAGKGESFKGNLPVAVNHKGVEESATDSEKSVTPQMPMNAVGYEIKANDNVPVVPKTKKSFIFF